MNSSWLTGNGLFFSTLHTVRPLEINDPSIKRLRILENGRWTGLKVGEKPTFLKTKQVVLLAYYLLTNLSYSICRPYNSKFFKADLPQTLLGPFLNTLTHMIDRKHEKGNLVNFMKSSLTDFCLLYPIHKCPSFEILLFYFKKWY